MRVVEFTPDMRQKWEEFVPRSNNGTLFHLQEFLEYHPPDRFENRHLIFEDRGKWVALLPAAAKDRDGLRIHVSHPGASFGGVATAMSVGVKGAHRIVDLWVEWAKHNGFDGVEFTRV
ncbi:hypothetical protein J7L01_07205, partial [bacterium]|nr:hypothetical protein [bacterium]